MDQMRLPGLERLLEMCHRLRLPMTILLKMDEAGWRRWCAWVSNIRSEEHSQRLDIPVALLSRVGLTESRDFLVVTTC
jgi:hypothetical protein